MNLNTLQLIYELSPHMDKPEIHERNIAPDKRNLLCLDICNTFQLSRILMLEIKLTT